MHPVLGWADFPYYYAPTTSPRPMHVANMLLEVKRWLQKTMPWWDRRGGRDHIWLMPHDEGGQEMGGRGWLHACPPILAVWTSTLPRLESTLPHLGACYMPTEIYNSSIMLTHWGRLDLDHSSNTGWPPDNYSHPVIWPGYQV